MVTGSLLFSSGSTSRFDLDAALSTNDHIGGLASVTYDGTLQLVYPPDTLAGSDAFHLFAATNYAGAFAEVSPSIPGPEQEWDLTDLAVNGILRVSAKPYITSEPQDLTVFVGADAPFTVVAGGSTSMSYQWRFNETNIAGATGSTYTRTNAQFEDAGGYTVVITNYLGSITSQVATLTVESPIARDVVISQIYGGGGGSGATYQNDFIELFNPTTNTIDLSTRSVHHTGAGGTTWTAANLSGSIAPHVYYLVQLCSSGANGVALPPADAVSTINANAANGKVVLMIGNLPLSGSNPIGMPGVVDFVGYGTANAYEGSGPAAVPLIANNTTSILRKDGGYLDANDNANDFTKLSPPAPRNSSAPPNLPSTPVISATLSSARYTTNHFEFLVTGTPGSNYVVQATTNLLLSPWLFLHTNASPFIFADTNASGYPLRFYRAVHLLD
jgi:hypothetical protein